MPIVSPEEIDRAVACLREGRVVAFPTDTLYALGADALEPEAVGRVIEIKRRPPEMGIPLLLSNADSLETVAIHVPEVAWELARRFWPGPLTLVLKRAPGVPSVVTGGRESVAVRVPDHPLALDLIGRLGRPVTGTSANISGGSDPVTAEQVRRYLGEACGLILDGGPAPLGVSSTIVDITRTRPRLVRAGAVPWEAVESAASARSA